MTTNKGITKNKLTYKPESLYVNYHNKMFK